MTEYTIRVSVNDTETVRVINDKRQLDDALTEAVDEVLDALGLL